MTIVKKNTKKAQEILNTYENPWQWYSDIFEAYARPSARKVWAWERCKAICEEEGGRGLMIIGKNCTQFTAYFNTPAGEIYKITKENVYKVEA